MCGRFNVSADPLVRLLEQLLGIAYAPVGAADRFNLAPTATVPVLRQGADGAVELTPMKWWLMPYWSRQPKPRYATFNARVETAATSASFREPYRKRRCVVPISGFYEWAKTQVAAPASGNASGNASAQARGRTAKLPYYLKPSAASGLLLAGLWDRWQDSQTKAVFESFTVLTTEANAALRFVHDRQPVMLSIADARRWLDHRTPTAELEDRFASLLPVTLEVVPVSTYVNNARNDGPRCITPIGDALLIGGAE